MTKRMLIDDTQPEETRVVVVNGNKLEEVEFESSNRKQIKGNIYLGKIMRVEPSLQACFVDYGGNKHGFMAFGEIHPDYYNLSEEVIAEVEKEVDDIIENKKRIIKERELERERRAKERAIAREEALRAKAEAEEKAKQEALTDEAKEVQSDKTAEIIETAGAKEIQSDKTAEIVETAEANVVSEDISTEATVAEEANDIDEKALSISEEEFIAEEEAKEEEEGKKKTKRRVLKKKFRKKIASESGKENQDIKVLAEDSGLEEEKISQEAEVEVETEAERNDIAETSSNDETDNEPDEDNAKFEEQDDNLDDDDDDDDNMDFELQRRLIKARKLYHRHKIQDVIKEGQIVLVQVVKEERGNKGAALTTYLSLAGRYCVLMPNRIKSGGVSRKITNAADRNRLKGIVKELPLGADMSIIVRTAGEEKSKSDIVRDYNYLIRAWNQIRIDALKNKAPKLIYEEGNLIKRALRDIYTKEISEILVAGDTAFKLAKDFFKILSPHNLKKIKSYKNNDMPLFQRFQVEGQLDKLHDSTAQLESGGYLVINPTEALVSIDVNSGRATKEKDLEETALKTNLEACDEIARQLRLRNLAGLVVIDFIDMDEPANNHAVEKRMKEALKKDRSRIQVGKMSIFGLLELSRQRMHSAFWESNYQVCPYCHGKGITRTIESAGIFVLRMIEEEGCKNRLAKIVVSLPTDVAVYLLNQKRKTLVELENKYNFEVVICADNSIKCVSDCKIERTKNTVKEEKPEAKEAAIIKEIEEKDDEDGNVADMETKAEAEITNDNDYGNYNRRGRRGRFERRGNRRIGNRQPREHGESTSSKQEAVILYDSHDNGSKDEKANQDNAADDKKGKSAWWKKLIKG